MSAKRVGRPRVKSTERKGFLVSMRLTPKQRVFLEEKTLETGHSISAYLRHLVKMDIQTESKRVS